MTEESSGIKIHPTAEIHPTVLLEGNITIGEFSKIESGTIISGDVTIGHHTFIRCNVVIRGQNKIGNYVHIYDSVCIERGRPPEAAEVADQSIIGDNCWIATNAVILPGVELGEHVIVGAGSVVTQSFKENNILIGGVPAKIIKKLDNYET